MNNPQGRVGRRQPVTSHDVAAEAGVSQATVTRVFSSPDLVAPDTQQRVRDAADRIGYVPNAIARSLKSQRTDIVGAVVPTQGEYWQSVLTSFSRRLAEKGKQLLLFSFADADHVVDALDAVGQYRLDGLVLASSTISQEHLVRMRRPGRICRDRAFFAGSRGSRSGRCESDQSADCSDYHRRRCSAPKHIAKFRRLIVYLIKTHSEEIHEHQFGHGSQTCQCRTSCRTNYGTFGNWCIYNTFVSELFV